MKKKILLLSFLLLSLGMVVKTQFQGKSPLLHDPHFHNNPYLDERMKALMAPYLLSQEHPLKPALDLIFSQSRATENETALLHAGFSIIAAMPGSFVIVARHPAVPGYVFKLYLDSEKRHKDEAPNCEWLTRRCIGAEKLRKIIQKRKLRYFTVPDKWLYVLPLTPVSREPHPQPVIVVETDMELVSEEETVLAWKKAVTPQHLDELYLLLKYGYGTKALVRNIPYTKHGTFAFTDTEYPERRVRLKKIKSYFSEEMQKYWESL